MAARDTQFVRGAERLSRRISTIRTRLQLPPLVEEVSQLLLRRTKDRFLREITPDYVPWAELAQSTLRRKERGGWGAAQKLVRTGKMRDAIQILRGSILAATFFNTGGGLRIGIDDPEIAEYARIQNQGSARGGRIPARRFLGVGRLDVKAVDSLLRRKAVQLENL